MSSFQSLVAIDRGDYALGLLTLPLLYAALRLILWLTDSTSSWHLCGLCSYQTTTKWDRLKRLQLRRHERRVHAKSMQVFKDRLAEADDMFLDDKAAYHYAWRHAREAAKTEAP